MLVPEISIEGMVVELLVTPASAFSQRANPKKLIGGVLGILKVVFFLIIKLIFLSSNDFRFNYGVDKANETHMFISPQIP